MVVYFEFWPDLGLGFRVDVSQLVPALRNPLPLRFPSSIVPSENSITAAKANRPHYSSLLNAVVFVGVDNCHATR
jgi:hypothetical protein